MLKKKNLFRNLQVIKNEKYDQICEKLKSNKSSTELNKEDANENSQKVVNSYENGFQDFLCFQMKQSIELLKPSQAIILFRHNYQHLQNQNYKDYFDQGVKQIVIQFYEKKFSQESKEQLYQGKPQHINPLTILIQSTKASINRSQTNLLNIPFKKIELFQDFSQKNSFTDLQQKIWLELNKKLNKIALHVGDIQSIQSKKTVIFDQHLLCNVKKKNYDWKHCEKTLDQIDKNKKESEHDLSLKNLSEVRMFFKVKRRNIQQLPQKNSTVEIKNLLANLKESFSINIFPPQFLQGPKIQESPNLFHQQISQIVTLPSQVKMLHGRMKEMNLATLCRQYPHLKDNLDSLNEQIIGELIHNSLMTPWGYVSGKDGCKIPIGLLNHLMCIKTGNKLKPLSLQNLLTSNLYDDITINRQGYVRFEIVHPHHLCPGNCGIIQIWPPFYCSPIHNHGESIGVIKVLKGEVRIENYESLSCQIKKQVPYMKKDYRKGDYTWLCPESYGVHRVLNMTSSTAITLQAYYDHNQGSEEYFTFVKQNTEAKQSKHDFARYYPQHDWINYINMNSVQKIQDRLFIKQVSQFYGLKTSHKEGFDFSFAKFIGILQKQYYLMRSLIDDID